MLHPARTQSRDANPQAARDRDNSCHRRALDIALRLDTIPTSDACDHLGVVVAATDDPMLRYKCLDLLHYLAPVAPNDMPQQVEMAAERLRGYCRSILER